MSLVFFTLLPARFLESSTTSTAEMNLTTDPEIDHVSSLLAELDNVHVIKVRGNLLFNVVFTFTFTFTSTSRLVEERLFESDLLECSDLPIVPELFLLPGICEMFSQGGGTLFKLLIGVDIFRQIQHQSEWYCLIQNNHNMTNHPWL